MSDYWTPTIELYQDFIDYPQVVQKYLKRPPFNLNSKTNFAEGMFSEEQLNKEYYNTPDRKMEFLKKVLKYVYSVSDNACPIKPQSIIKGIESDKVNVFLQDLFKAATSGQSYQNLRGEIQQKSASSKKEQKLESKENLERSEKRKASKQRQIEKQENQEKSRVVREIQEKVEKEKNILKNTEKEEQVVSIKMQGIQNDTQQDKNQQQVPQEGQITNKELQSYIQKITQNISPLGKLVEFVDDDISLMNKERRQWNQKYLESQNQLKKIEAEQEQEMKNLYYQIQELDEQIDIQKQKNCIAYSKIQKNEKKIETLLYNLI